MEHRQSAALVNRLLTRTSYIACSVAFRAEKIDNLFTAH